MGVTHAAWALVVIMIGGSPFAARAQDARVVPPARPDSQATRLPKGAVQSEIDRFYREWERDAVVGAFKRAGGGDPKWSDDAARFLERCVDWYVQWDGAVASAALAVEGQRLISRGCKDPMVSYFTARVFDDRRNIGKTDLKFAEAEKALAASGYSRAHLAELCSLLADHRRQWNDPEGQKTAFTRASDAWVEWLRAQRAAGAEPRYQLWHIYSQISEEMPRDTSRALIDRCLGDPGIDPWVSRTLEGVWERVKAWDLRGTAFAGEVKPEQWKGFAEHLALARRALTAAHDMAPDRPEAASEMIAVAMGENRKDQKEEQKQWFERSTAAQFDYISAYDSYFWALRPRWGGSHLEMLEFGRRCRDSGRYDTMVPFQYVRALRDVCEDSKDFSRTWSRAELLESSLDVIRKTAEKCPSPRQVRWALSYGVALTWWGQRLSDGYPLLEKTGFELDSEAAAQLKLAPDMVARDVLTFGGPAKDLYSTAGEAASAGNFEEAAKRCAEAADRCKELPAPVREAALSRAESSRALADFQKGEWVSLDLSGERRVWRTVRGSWRTLKAANAAVGLSEADYFAAAAYPRFGRRFEMETTIKFGPKPAEGAGAGILVGFEWATSPEPAWQSVVVHPVQGTMRAGPGVDERGSAEAKWEFAPGKDVRLRVVMWDTTVAVFVDGAEIYRGNISDPERGFNTGQNVGLYARSGKLNAGTEFSDVRIRKITTKPAASPRF